MKKLILGLIIALVAVAAVAEMDNRSFAVSTITTNADSATYTLRGELESVFVTIPAGKTCTVAVASTEGTLFSKADMTSATDGLFPVRVPLYSTAGAALTEVDAGSNTNALYGKAAIAGAITATFTPAAATTGTNAYSVNLIYNR